MGRRHHRQHQQQQQQQQQRRRQLMRVIEMDASRVRRRRANLSLIRARPSASHLHAAATLWGPLMIIGLDAVLL